MSDWRIEGHHLSQNYTVTNGQVLDGPSFFGCNPAEVRQGLRKGLRTLAGEDDLGFAVIHALDEPQQKIAIVDPKAYRDILTAANRKAALQGQPSGLPGARMNARQFDALRALVELYAYNLPDELAERRMDQINKAGRNVYFAWAGGIKPGDPHYYRVQTSSFLIEFDDTQDNANHIHSVWRDFNGDFGGDPLRAHYEASHGIQRGSSISARYVCLRNDFTPIKIAKPPLRARLEPSLPAQRPRKTTTLWAPGSVHN
jgi:hypothetical protein